MGEVRLRLTEEEQYALLWYARPLGHRGRPVPGIEARNSLLRRGLLLWHGDGVVRATEAGRRALASSGGKKTEEGGDG